MTQHARICVCEHGHLCHRYLSSTGANTGFCMAPNCWCEVFEDASMAVNSTDEGGRIEQADEVRQHPIGSNRPTPMPSREA